jgi:hypothetical protein
MHLMCKPSSSTTSTTPPRIYSTTSDACTVSPLMVCRLADEAQRMEAQGRTEDVFSECATEYRRRLVSSYGGSTSTSSTSMRSICHQMTTDACVIGAAGIHHGIRCSVVKGVE